jgi:phosphotransferase system enzyme I (PtsI)
MTGLATARGFAVGPVFIYRGEGDVPIPEYLVPPERVEDELMRLKHAARETKRDLETLIAAVRERSGSGAERVFESHLMILEDPILSQQAEDKVRKDRLNAEAAVRRTVDSARASFERMNDPYFRERVRDFDDLERRILRILAGLGAEPVLSPEVPSIIVANDLTPSETVRLPRNSVLGFALNGGSSTSHVALLARAMGVPAVSGLGDVTSQVSPGETILLDGTNGIVTLRPSVSSVLSFRDLVERQRELNEEASLVYPAGTLKDGSQVKLLANFHQGVPPESLREHGARGIGLYRSEYLWIGHDREPTEEEQFIAYREVAELASTLDPDGEVTIRALDVGGDKAMRGVSTEPNPFLGNRSIRYLLSFPEVLKTQLRAVLRASVFGKVRIMYPMVACLEEIDAAAEVLEQVKRELDAEGVAYDRSIPVGMMVEVPSAALNAEAFAAKVDFFSIGTNDLVQYTLAADRGNESVAHLYQPANPAVLSLVRMTVAAAKKHSIPVSVCGVSASDPLIGLLWAALGVDHLSMSTTYIPVLAKLFSRLSREDLNEISDVVCALGGGATAVEVVEKCRQAVASKIPDLDNIII